MLDVGCHEGKYFLTSVAPCKLGYDWLYPSMHNLETASKIIVAQGELEGNIRGLVQLSHFTDKESEAQRAQIQFEVTLLMNGKAWAQT